MAEHALEGTQTTKQTMYPQLKRSLENFIEEFRYLSLRYGPIRHEMFKAYDQQTTAETWIAFVKMGVDSRKARSRLGGMDWTGGWQLLQPFFWRWQRHGGVHYSR